MPFRDRIYSRLRAAHKASDVVNETSAVAKRRYSFLIPSGDNFMQFQSAVLVCGYKNWGWGLRPDDDNATYVPLHKACLQIVKGVIAFRLKEPNNSTPGLGVTSMQDLLMVLDFRGEVERPSGGRYLGFRKLLPYEKDVGAHECKRNPDNRDCDWVYHHRQLFASRNEVSPPEKPFHLLCSSRQAVGADPIEIPFLTEWILSQLEVLSQGSSAPELSSKKKTAHHLNWMPTEIIDLVISHLDLSTNTPLQCTRILAPMHWRRALAHLGVFPWLWDLDHKAIGDKEATCESLTWDWELLVRRLAQPMPLETFACSPLKYSPPGLRNRRWIWKHVDEMRTDEDALYKPVLRKELSH